MRRRNRPKRGSKIKNPSRKISKSGTPKNRIFKNILLICVFAAAFLFFSQKFSFENSFDGLFSGETTNGFAPGDGDILFKYEEDIPEGAEPEDSFENPGGPHPDGPGPLPASEDEQPLFGVSIFGDIAEQAAGTDRPVPLPTQTPLKIDKLEDSQRLLTVSGVLGINDVIFQPETDSAGFRFTSEKEAVTLADINKLRDMDYLRSSFYAVNNLYLGSAQLAVTSADFDADAFVNTDLKIDNSVTGPKILIFHTHSYEMYADSDIDDPMDGVVGVGRQLAEILETKYGIETLHHTGRYDLVDGSRMILGAYERMEPEIEKILAANPSVQIAIDIHRDGIPDDRRLVTTENGVQMAQIMFVNGLCKLYDNGVLRPIQGLSNPYVQTNLAFSFMAQLEANALYPNFTRRIYLNAYRYSLNMLPKSLLIEVGAQTNTKQEALNAMYPLADVLAAVVG